MKAKLSCPRKALSFGSRQSVTLRQVASRPWQPGSSCRHQRGVWGLPHDGQPPTMQPMVWPCPVVVNHRAGPGRARQAVARPTFCHALGFALPARSPWSAGRPAFWRVAMKHLDRTGGWGDRSPMAFYAHPGSSRVSFEGVALQGRPLLFWSIA